MKTVLKNVEGLDIVLSRMVRRMGLAGYAERTIQSYTRSVRVLGQKLGKSPENVEQDELHEYLLAIKDRMSQHPFPFSLLHRLLELDQGKTQPRPKAMHRACRGGHRPTKH